jgi:prevent-host-death family protein
VLDVRTISQRELRNDNAEIMREVELGETFIVTRRGVPVAQIVPYGGTESGLRIDRPARSRAPLSEITRVTSSVTSEEILADLKDDR